MTITPNPGTDWPDNIQGCTITGRYIDVTGMPIQGKVHFTPSPAALLNADRDVIVVSRRITATLDIDGAFEITVPATDDPDVNPTGWTYEVFEDFTGGRKYSITAPQNTAVDLADISPVPSSPGNAIVVGPKGDPGAPAIGAKDLFIPVTSLDTYGAYPPDKYVGATANATGSTYVYGTGYNNLFVDSETHYVDMYAVWVLTDGSAANGNIVIQGNITRANGTNNPLGGYPSWYDDTYLPETTVGVNRYKEYNLTKMNAYTIGIRGETTLHFSLRRNGAATADTYAASIAFVGVLLRKPA